MSTSISRARDLTGLQVRERLQGLATETRIRQMLATPVVLRALSAAHTAMVRTLNRASLEGYMEWFIGVPPGDDTNFVIPFPKWMMTERADLGLLAVSIGDGNTFEEHRIELPDSPYADQRLLQSFNRQGGSLLYKNAGIPFVVDVSSRRVFVRGGLNAELLLVRRPAEITTVDQVFDAELDAGVLPLDVVFLEDLAALAAGQIVAWFTGNAAGETGMVAGSAASQGADTGGREAVTQGGSA